MTKSDLLKKQGENFLNNNSDLEYASKEEEFE